jgi:hypothetical protein
MCITHLPCTRPNNRRHTNMHPKSLRWFPLPKPSSKFERLERQRGTFHSAREQFRHTRTTCFYRLWALWASNVASKTPLINPVFLRSTVPTFARRKTVFGQLLILYISREIRNSWTPRWRYFRCETCRLTHAVLLFTQQDFSLPSPEVFIHQSQHILLVDPLL